MAKLTIVTLTYNHERYIEQALKNFVSQKTNFDFEVLVSDDCSTDNTQKIIAKYAKKYPKIIKPIFSKKNVGSMKNFITTLDKINSEYVALCDGDDYWCDNNKLQKQVDFLDNNPDYNICFHQVKVFFEDGSNDDEICPSKNFPKTTTFENILKENYIPANSVVYRWMFKKGEVSKILSTNVTPGDYFIHLFHAQKYKIGFINEVMSCYRRHRSGIWWLTSQSKGQDDFYLKYGLNYLRFFNLVENYFKLSNDTYKMQKEYLMNNLIRCYVERKMFDNLFELKNENNLLFTNCLNNLNFTPIYKKLSKFRKGLYLLFIEPSKLKEKLKDKIKNNRLVKIVKKN